MRTVSREELILQLVEAVKNNDLDKAKIVASVIEICEGDSVNVPF